MQSTIYRNFIKYAEITLFSICFFIAVFLRLHLLHLPLERDEGEYAYAGSLILHGAAPYADSYNMKFPGTYYMLAGIEWLFGESAGGVRTGMLCVHVISLLLLMFCTQKLWNSRCALFAGSAFLLLNATFVSQGILAKAEQFVVLFALAGFVCMIAATRKPGMLLYLAAGICMLLSIAMKQTGFLFALTGCFFILLNATRKLRALWMYAAGGIIVIVAFLIILFEADTYHNFVYFTFHYASAYAGLVSFHTGMQILHTNGMDILQYSSIIFYISAMSLLVTVFKMWNDRLLAFLFVFVLLSCIAICPGLYFRYHYFILLYPAVAFLYGWVAGIKLIKYELVYRSAFCILLCLSVIYYVQKNKNLLWEQSPEMLVKQMFPWSPFFEASAAGKTIESVTELHDQIGMIGSEPEIAFYAHRRLASGFMYLYPLLEDQQYAEEMTEKMLSEIQTAKPRIIIFSEISWVAENKQTDSMIRNWWAFYKTRYTLIEKICTTSPSGVITLRGDSLQYPLSGYAPCIEIYMRKEL